MAYNDSSSPYALLVAVFFLLLLTKLGPAMTAPEIQPRQRRQLSGSSLLTDKDLREELLKLERQRILEKLRLQRPPDVSLLSEDLPAFSLPSTFDYEERRTVGTVKTVYLAGERRQHDRSGCSGQWRDTVVCVEFELSAQQQQRGGQELLNATLWLHLQLVAEQSSEMTQRRVRLSLYVVHRHGHRESAADNLQASVGRGGSWVSVNFTGHIGQLMASGHRRITLAIDCLNCDRMSPIESLHRTPFIELNMRESPAFDARQKRSKNCGPDFPLTSECCLETLYVNFTEIGWNQWILQPPGYNAGFCKGRCRSTATSNYNSIMRALVSRRLQEVTDDQNDKFDPEMMPCCSPSKMQPLQILYATVENNHRSIASHVLKDMIVAGCTC